MDIAGFVLTVLPLVLKGLREINDGSRKFIGYRRALGRIVRQFEVENLKLQNTCRNLLADIVPVGNLQMLLDGKGWDDPGFNIQLENRLGFSGKEIFKRHMEDLKSIFLQLRSELGITDDLKVRHGPSCNLNMNVRMDNLLIGIYAASSAR
jgi:hypothetical protein